VFSLFDQSAALVVDFMREHAAWAAPATFVIAFLESLAFVSLFVPATVILLGLGALVATGAIGFWEVFAAGVAGAVLGNSLSYWVGRRFKGSIAHSWPFRQRPELLTKGHSFFDQHGGKSVFFGRFFGPTRAVVPLVAGMTEMPKRRFLAANALSAIVWVLLSISPALWGGSFAIPGLPGIPAEAASAPAPADPQAPAVPIR
jgi:membrane protein DedA with SNARE-associated domain